MRRPVICLIFITGMFIISCNSMNDVADAYGNFEVQEILVAAEANGVINSLELEEGQTLEKDQQIGYIDTSGLTLQNDVLRARQNAVRSRSYNVIAETMVLEEQKRALLTEKTRIENLLKDGAATTKQLDDINSNLRVFEKRIAAIKTQTSNINAELIVVNKQIDQVTDQIKRARIKAPIDGTVLEKYAEQSEMVNIGKPIFKIANLESLILRVFISGSQLTSIELGQRVFVYVDQNAGEMLELEGTVSWISSQAEFTPKIIQTKEERVKLVYAVKILVKNDGSLKIGMPGEVRFQTEK